MDGHAGRLQLPLLFKSPQPPPGVKGIGAVVVRKVVGGGGDLLRVDGIEKGAFDDGRFGGGDGLDAQHRIGWVLRGDGKQFEGAAVMAEHAHGGEVPQPAGVEELIGHTSILAVDC